MSTLPEITQENIGSSSKVRPPLALPKLSELIVPPLTANGLIISFLLIEKHLLLASGVVGGLAVGLVVFSVLHYFAEQVFGLLFLTPNAGREPLPGNMIFFGFLAGGKFVLVGLLMYVLIAVLHLSVVAFAIGFVVTQVCVSLSVINRLAKSKVTH